MSRPLWLNSTERLLAITVHAATCSTHTTKEKTHTLPSHTTQAMRGQALRHDMQKDGNNRQGAHSS